MRIRLARSDEADTLSNLCVRSKAHWGYDEAFMTLSRTALTVCAAQINAGDVWVAEIDGAAIGIVSLAATDDPRTVDLDKIFVEPTQMRSGVGRALMQFAITEARRRAFKTMTILADPNAAPFYENIGAKYLRQAPSDAIPGRPLPFYEIVL